MPHSELRDLPDVQAALQAIASDHHSGAAEILQGSAQVFVMLDASCRNRTLPLQRTQAVILETCSRLIRAQAAMAPLARLANAAWIAAMQAAANGEALRSAATSAAAFVRHAHEATQAAARHAARLISGGVTVLTHSRSSTLLAACQQAQRGGATFKVIVTESRPLLEGRTLAENLRQMDVPVTLIADAAAAAMMESVSLILVGADRITPDEVVNKIGTRMIALAARERGVCLYVISDSSKFIGSKIAQSDALQSPEELWPAAPHGVMVVNRCFEATPPEWFTGIITEEGMLLPEEAKRLAQSQPLDAQLLTALQQ